MGATSLTATVVVPTAGRPEQLRRLLAALPAALGDLVPDVLVIDNAPAQPVAGVVAGAPLPVRYVVEPRPGSAHARNRALAESTGDVLAFLDDDVVPHAGWLPALLSPLLDPGVVAVGGPVRLDPDVARPAWLAPGVTGYLSEHDLGPAPLALGADQYLLTANAAFRRSALRAAGGFDPRLGPRPGQQFVADDVHVVRELRRRGGLVRWQPTAVVTHDLPAARLRRRWLLQRAYLQGRSDWLLDVEELSARRLGGARVAAGWFARELGRRRGEGLRHPDVRFHLVLDAARTAGALRQGMPGPRASSA